MKSGYSAHYILVNHAGVPAKINATHYFDEVVIGQESQVVPAFIVSMTSEYAVRQMKKLDGRNVSEESDINLEVF
jgi:hypothetical protein